VSGGNYRLNGELPHTLHIVTIKQIVFAYNRNSQVLRLSHEQSVEWIAMMQRQEAGPSGVLNGDRQFSEALFLKPLRESSQ
jgi:hypothetical protein